MDRRQFLQGGAALALSGCAAPINVGPVAAATPEEMRLLVSFMGNPQAIRKWVATEVTPMFYDQLLGGEFWAPALYFFRIKKGDCDEVLALSHYCLHTGKGIYLHGRGEKMSHVVYAPEESNGRYSIISILKHEHREGIFRSIDDVALSFPASEYDYYQEVTLPDNAEMLLSSPKGIEKGSTYGSKKPFPG